MEIKERILCAAIWYKDMPLIRDDMPNGFIRPLNCERGIVFSGHRHHNCLYQMVALTGKAQHEVGEHVQGFLTSTNRFVDRKEGMMIALKNDQVINPYHSDTLFSEDLY